MPGYVAKLAKLRVVSHGQNKIPIGRGEVLIRHDIRMSITHALRRLARSQVIEALIGQASHLHIQ